MKASWIEIPVKDLERANKFYQTIFRHEAAQIIEQDVRRITILPSPEGQATASLNQTANFEPSDKGILVYFDVEESLDALLARVETAGGKVVDGKTQRGEYGYFAIILDSEGNALTLHSMKS
jgi:uncharacterized protein